MCVRVQVCVFNPLFPQEVDLELHATLRYATEYVEEKDRMRIGFHKTHTNVKCLVNPMLSCM